MNYAKPELRLLGDACSLIELCDKSNCSGDGDTPDRSDSPAYDLDEQ